ncbi:MAG: RHS repeat domain-containing protein, partial [Paracoccaceae bacterium]
APPFPPRGEGMGEGGTCGNDSLGNRLTSRLGTATDTYTYPATSNRLSMINLVTGGTRGFTYDASGSVTAEARPGGTYGYTYNAAGRMSEFRINGILQASYKYDAMGRQAIRTLSSPTAVTIHSVFDSDGRRIAEYNETSGALIREYVWNCWEPVAVIEGGVISFVRADHIGRPVFATNASGVKTWTATYTPFGGVHTSTGAPPSARFPGQWFQTESGLHQNWMRDYDPTTGRYLQADPLGLVDGASVYGYVRQNPGRFTDPTGLWAVGPQSHPSPDYNPYTEDLVQCGLRDACYQREAEEKDRCYARHAVGEIKHRRACLERAPIRRDMCIRGIRNPPPEWGTREDEDYDPEEPYIPHDPFRGMDSSAGDATGVGIGGIFLFLFGWAVFG